MCDTSHGLNNNDLIFTKNIEVFFGLRTITCMTQDVMFFSSHINI